MIKSSHWLFPTLVIALALTACGKSNQPESAAPGQSSAQSTPEASKPAEAAKPQETAKSEDASATDDHLQKGEKIFKGTCSMCHQTGAAGAPIVGNKDEWGPRIAQGKPTLYEHALNGFTGKTGMMPARGGNSSLKDDDIKAAVDYMVSKVK